MGERTLSQTTHISPALDFPADEPRAASDRLLGLSLTAWVQIVAVAVLMAATFRFNLARLWGKTNPINGQDSNWQHSVFVPLIGIYYLYIHRDELLKAAGMPVRREQGIRILASIGLGVLGLLAIVLVRNGETGFQLMAIGALAAGLVVPVALPTSNALGSVVLLEGLMIFTAGIYPIQNDYVKDLGMVITLFGAVTLLAGWPVMKVAWFPIAFLVVALPWPELVYAKLAWPLQQLAASAAVGTLRVFGVSSQNFGTRIMFFDAENRPRMLNVAEACAGLKSVMTFLMVAGTVAFLSARPLWEKLVITVSAIPIAIFCNVVRVAGQGLLDRYSSHEWSQGFAHQFAGLVMLIPGFFLILFVGWALEKLFIEEVDKNKLALAGAAAAANRAKATGKRMIVEVPRRELPAEPEATSSAAAPAAEPTALLGSTAATTQTAAPARPTPPQAAAAPVARTTVAPPAATRPAAAPARPAAARPPAAPVGGSTLKASAPKAPGAAGTRPAPVAPPPASTLKPSSRPASAAPPRTPATPSSGLKPSTLKPSSPKPPAAPGGGLKPPAAPGAQRPPSLQPPRRVPPPPPPPSADPNT